MYKRWNAFLQQESFSGCLLVIMTLVALIWANSSFAFLLQYFINTSVFWINDGLMAIFFFLIGLELKREIVEGELSRPGQVMLPLAAAIGGMIVPALIYIAINFSSLHTVKGWATPVATDIAFALGVLSLFGRRVPIALKLFLLALAIFDDMGAIIIITFFYTHHLSYTALFEAAVFVSWLFMLNMFSLPWMSIYLLLGVGLWSCLLTSGIHPTIAGVILAFFIPRGDILRRLEHLLRPWVAYFIMPLFVLANAGISFSGMTVYFLFDKIVLGIVAGLFIGKQIGVLGFSWVFIRCKYASLPTHVSWRMLYGVSILCGMGFTMSLFLGTLSFHNEPWHLVAVRLGVIVGSILSGLIGACVLLTAFSKEFQRSSSID